MLSPGDRLGPYEVVSALGAGGMGEVYRARDTRLGREVALKVLPEDVASDHGRLKRFEREARATAALSHVNVISVFDVGSEGGRAFVVTEILDGTTLGARLRRGPLAAREALGLAAQAARGIAAAHAKGIVHRDVKPDNLFLTTSGILKVLDFGLASLRSGDHAHSAETTDSNPTGPGAVLGTVSYMSPEQAKGHSIDARSDLFSLGIVLHEMLSGRHPFKRTSSAETVSAILRDEPPDLATLEGSVPGAVEQLVRRCLEKHPNDRFQTASDLAIALDLLARGEGTSARSGARRGEDTTLSAPADERPYPGLSSFTEADAAHFFGREGEVRALWEKIRRQKLLAVIGPSGVGKTSFLRAGVLAHKPTGWSAVYTTPGADPALALAQALTPQAAGDPEAMAGLLRGLPELSRGEEPAGLIQAFARWRARHTEALVVIDQAEELFTQSSPEIQAAIAAVTGRLAGEADVHVVLSLRDDFLFRCAEHPPLAAVFHDLTPLTPPSSEALRRALVEPAARLGVRFEDQALVDTMLAAVSGERGALPLLAFAASRLWEERDRERGLITSEAYGRIGGVAGALAQHAEAVLEQIGTHRIALVRELFRNLVTAQGTRAVRERDELLSVFSRQQAEAAANAGWSRDAAEAVLDALVGARLLTSYERDGEAGGKQRQVEIVHESLLASWPRLVRWRTQDADGVQLRDHLHQAAQLWQDRGRPEDLLWSGAAYRDLALWRERHRVPLTAAEDDFVRAAETKATRRRRRRRAAVAALVTLAASVAIVTSALWRSADVSRQKAEAETRRAEASRLLALGQLERESYPTAAVAWAIRSLELADTPEARLFALGILQASPTAHLVPMPANDMDGLEAMFPAFSPSGEWLAVGGLRRIRLLNRDGRPPRALGGYPSVGINGLRPLFGPLSDRLVTAQAADVRALSVPDGREIWNRPAPVESIGALALTRDAFLTAKLADRRLFVREWPLDGGEPSLVGSVQDVTDFDLQGSRLVHRNGRRIHLREVASWNVPIAVGGRLSSDRGGVAVSADGRLVAASDERGEIQIWRTSAQGPHPLRVLQARGWMQFDARGQKLAVASSQDGVAQARVFDLEGPPGAAPQVLRRSDIPYLNGVAFDPQGRWLALGNVDATSLWALDGHRPHVFKQESVSSIAFSPDGTTLMAVSGRGLRAWYLGKDAPAASRLLHESSHGLQFPGIAFDPSGLRVAVAGAQGWMALLPAQGGALHKLSGFSERADLRGTLFADGGRLLAATAFVSPRDEKVVRVWNLETGEVRTIGPVPGAGDGFVGAIQGLKGLGTYGAVLDVDGLGLVQVDLRTGSQFVVTKELDRLLDSSPAIGLLLACRFQRAMERCTPAILDLGRNDLRLLTTHGHSSASGAFDPSGTLIATGSFDGVVRLGRVSGEEPHVLLGLKGNVRSVAFSPDGRLVAAGDEAGTIHLWPVPDVAKTPFHLKPHAELLAALRTHTNLRAVADAAAPGGYKLEAGPFPGWAQPPMW